jgi:glucose-6-phosphate 1-dehydrogenase (EC 1.1.1.49)
MKDLSAVMVIFGGTGDLTHRKLMPSLYNLFHQNLLPDSFAVVSIGRREFSDEEYIEGVKNSIGKFSRFKIEETAWEK